ncbi:MAG: ATP-binding cassette domain-containing protein, partial [Myxococcota bacterium]
MVEVRSVVKTYRAHGPLPWSPSREVPAVRDVSFSIGEGEVVALVGQSGSGKTTLARCILGLEPITSGAVSLDGMAWHAMSERARRPLRGRYQYVPQDALSALDPQQTAMEHVVESLVVLGGRGAGEA